MLKTITVNKRMRLDELIKYAWENDIKNTIYESDNGQIVKFLGNGRYESGWNFGSDDLFTARVEEEITEDTKFHILVGIYFLEEIESYNSITFYNRSIDDVRDRESESIYALIDNKLELIWESE